MIRLAWGAAVTLAALAPPAARAADPALCDGAPGTTAIIAPLERFAARIEQGGPLKIVAVGSSSTAGTGATSAAATYPSRLEVELRERLPDRAVDVVNQGHGGEDAPEELARLGRDVVALNPDLAIWQVGTNAVLRRDDLGADGEWMREGVDLLERSGIDVVLMDLQYAPRVLERASYGAMEDLIADTANHAHAGLFRRFALMRYWQRSHPADAPAMVGPDGLHMTDAGYGCLAADLADALAANWRAEAKLAQRAHPAAEALAGLHPPSRPIPPPADLRPKDASPVN